MVLAISRRKSKRIDFFGLENIIEHDKYTKGCFLVREAMVVRSMGKYTTEDKPETELEDFLNF